MRPGGLTVAMLAAALAGCSPLIGAYRNIRGLSQDDPNPATAPNAKNFARAEAEPYPNLATVPPPPSDALTAAARAQLLHTLSRSRTTLEATGRTLRAGGQMTFAAPPPPLPLPPGTGVNPPAPQGIHRNAKPQLGPGPRKPGAPPLPGPRESPLVSPRVAALPQPEASRPVLPPPPLPAVPPPAPAARGTSVPGGTALAAADLRPPPPPRFAPLAPPPPVLPAPPPAAAAATRLAEIRFPAHATALAPGDRAIIAQIAALAHRRPGTLRVVGFAKGGGSARRQLESFRSALDRAQAVAAALVQAGVPAARIKTEAAPAGAGSGGVRAEILLEP
ncbi:MAG: OmpA family protein [Stellaceae bacterium]